MVYISVGQAVKEDKMKRIVIEIPNRLYNKLRRELQVEGNIPNPTKADVERFIRKYVLGMEDGLETWW